MQALANILRLISYAIAILFGLHVLHDVSGNASQVDSPGKIGDLMQSFTKQFEQILQNTIPQNAGMNQLRSEANTNNHAAIGTTKMSGDGANTANHTNTSSLPSIYPIEGIVVISSGFGYRRDPFTGQRRFHNGIDIKVKTGTAIRSTGNGIIEDAGYDKYLGHFIKIKHSNKYQSIYGHLSGVIVREGQQVRIGQAIGYSGNSGRSKGPHLHYQINHRGKSVDPVLLHNSLNGKK